MSEKTYSSADIADWRPRGQRLLGIHWQQSGLPQLVDIQSPTLLCRFRGVGYVGHHHGTDAESGLPVQASRHVRPDGYCRPDGSHAAHTGIVLHQALGRTQHHISDLRVTDGSGHLDRHCVAGQEHAAVGVPGLCLGLSGIGGGNFACSMSNISSFFPKRLQGTGLGLNAGLGNFGVTTMQVLIPLVMTIGLFGSRCWWLHGAAQGQRLDSGQDPGGYTHLYPERGFYLGSHPVTPGHCSLVRHE
jgi:hypothetical protein